MSDPSRITSIDQLHLFTRGGTVVKSETGYSTQVHGHGGANNSNVFVSSSTTEHLRIFVAEADGDEFTASFEDLGIGVREGNRVSIIHAGNKALRSGYPIALVNHDTHQYAIQKSTVNRVMSVYKFGCLAIIGIFALLLMALLAFPPFGTVVAIAIALVWWSRRVAPKRKLAADILARVEEEAQRIR